MLTHFSPEQLQDPKIAEADEILRACVHCGFCTATCPTFHVRGDELDSPRGRIMLIKEMHEKGGEPGPAVVKHLDRCLTCLSCMTTCPSGVDYMHLVEGARDKIEASPTARPPMQRAVRRLLSTMMTSRGLFRWSMRLAGLAKPFAPVLPKRLKDMVSKAPALSSSTLAPGIYPAHRPRKARVALLAGCAQAVVGNEINQAALRLLIRHGAEVVVASAPCCGALPQHMGQAEKARALAAQTIEGWWKETQQGGGEGLDAIVITTSGCGTSIKDYAHLFPADAKAALVAELALDVSEWMERTGLQTPVNPTGQRVAYHAACSLQHGQKQRTLPQKLLREAGFVPMEVADGHFCCGSAGTYNILQPELANELKSRKQANIRKIQPEWVATGNLGCILQLTEGLDAPVVHTVQLLDWATGGPKPNGVA
ncbi:MAG TPA: glycolate oxidase subunit GlcF [Magnetospirillaceae bacterium]|nr:glycolate oxidase subunit GlcF [Magnetospirillaceae bacterium]